jgi:hypothetical protein
MKYKLTENKICDLIEGLAEYENPKHKKGPRNQFKFFEFVLNSEPLTLPRLFFNCEHDWLKWYVLLFKKDGRFTRAYLVPGRGPSSTNNPANISVELFTRRRDEQLAFVKGPLKREDAEDYQKDLELFVEHYDQIMDHFKPKGLTKIKVEL